VASETRVALLLAVLIALITATAAFPIARAETYSVSFMVFGIPTGVNTRYYVDGILNGTIQTGETKTLNFTPGRVHTLSVDLFVSGNDGTRYQCGDNLWSFTDAGTRTFNYKAQYYLEVLSPYGSPSGTNWYDEGATAYARLTQNMTEGPEGVKYVFAMWEGDASGQNMISDPIVMDHPKKTVATWKTQYRLRISSDPIDIFPPSTLWFDAGSPANFTAPNGTASPDTRYVFTEWIGDYSGASPEGSLQMDGPKSVTAKYKTEYLLSLVFSPTDVAGASNMPRSGWYDAGSTALVGPVNQTIPVSPVERLTFISWNVDGMAQQGTSLEVLMTGPHYLEATYRTQYYLQVTSSLGETTGSGWYFTGENARFGVKYSGSDFPVKYGLGSWQSNPKAEITSVSPTEAEVKMDRPYLVEAVWNADYTPAWFLLFSVGSVVVVITGVGVVAVKRPGFFGRLVPSFRNSFGRRRKVRPPATAIPASLVHCRKCGAMVPTYAEFCQSCGAAVVAGQSAEFAGVEGVDDLVYDYIVKRQGEISLSRASKDLGLSPDQLKASTERLKKKGRLA